MLKLDWRTQLAPVGSAGPSAVPVGQESCLQEREFLPSLPIRLRETSDSRRQAPTLLCLPHGNEVREKNVWAGFSPRTSKHCDLYPRPPGHINHSSPKGTAGSSFLSCFPERTKCGQKLLLSRSMMGHEKKERCSPLVDCHVTQSYPLNRTFQDSCVLKVPFLYMYFFIF